MEVNAYTGKVIKADYENNRDWMICGMTVGMTTAITADDDDRWDDDRFDDDDHWDD